MYRQGDVLLIPVDPAQLPTYPAPQDRDPRGRLVLAHGEATGHAHVVSAPTARLLADPDQVDRRFLLLATQALLTHDEHAPIPSPPGPTGWCASTSTPPNRSAMSPTDPEARRLEVLSPEQHALLGRVRQEWLEVGLATGPADRPAAERGCGWPTRPPGSAPPGGWSGWGRRWRA